MASEPMTVFEAAAEMGVHPTHVTLLLRRGVLAGEKWSGDWMIDPASVRVYMKRHRRPTMGRPRKALQRS